MDYQEEIQRNRRQKISRAKPPKKSKHKHVFEHCILEYDDLRFSKEHGLTHDKPAAIIGMYCPICGKLSEVEDLERWFVCKKYYSAIIHTHYSNDKPTEEYARELNPATRTLPTFKVDNPWFTKFVTLPVTQIGE